ncbi:hypothetical protein ACOSQ4_028265 [Xanthoceras sorbifolium]
MPLTAALSLTRFTDRLPRLISSCRHCYCYCSPIVVTPSLLPQPPLLASSHCSCLSSLRIVAAARLIVLAKLADY